MILLGPEVAATSLPASSGSSEVYVAEDESCYWYTSFTRSPIPNDKQPVG